MLESTFEVCNKGVQLHGGSTTRHVPSQNFQKEQILRGQNLHRLELLLSSSVGACGMPMAT